MNNFQIRKLVKQKIAEGKSRSDAANEVREESKASLDKIVKITKGFIPHQARERYKSLNSILGALLILTALLKMLGIYGLLQGSNPGVLLFAMIIGPGINIAMAIGVFRYAPGIYQGILVLSALSVFRSLKQLQNFNEWMLIDYGIIAALMIMAGVLMAKLNTGATFKKEKYTTEEYLT